jgi:hypothetical protein
MDKAQAALWRPRGFPCNDRNITYSSKSAFINQSLEVLEIRFELRVRLDFERGFEPKNKVQPCPRAGLSCARVDPSGQTRKIGVRGQRVLGFGSRQSRCWRSTSFEMPFFLINALKDRV